jgi:hypothetical protein
VPIAPGDVLDGRFEIRGRAGEGGMGTVYRALDHLARREVAVKILRDSSPSDLGRFAREARLLAELDHPGIVRYVEHGTTEQGAPYLVLEWLAGETLGDVLHRRGTSAREGVHLVRRVAGALAAAHRRGIGHRDNKPDNVVFPAGDLARPVLIDFGIARRVSAPRDITRTGLMVGTPGYMAPEQARGEVIDARADVFALGCVLHECLSGAPAFTGATPTAVWVKVILCEPPDLRSAGIDPALADCVASFLAKSPDDRPADAAAVEQALAPLVAIPEGERRPGPTPSEAAPTEPLQAPACAVLVGPGDGDLAAMMQGVAGGGFRLAPLADGGAVAVPIDRGAPVAAAARFAARVAELLPARIIALAAGPSAIDRAAALVAEMSIERALEGGGGQAAGLVVIDPEAAAHVHMPVEVVGGRHRLR